MNYSIKPIVPAVVPNSAIHIQDTCAQFSFSQEYHLDVVDGNFVPTISWPYTPVGDPAEVKAYTDAYTLEVDLMVSDPIPMARAWEKAGADMLVFHIETVSVEVLRDFSTTSRTSIGVCLHGATQLETLFPYLMYADYVQLMGIRTIGAQGLPFDERVIEWITKLKHHQSDLTISVDGSMNEKTIPRVAAAGADRFICGSAIVSQPDPAAAYAALSALINAR